MIHNLRQLVAEGNIQQAIAECRQFTPIDANLHSEINLIAARFYAYEKQKNLDNTDKNALESERSQISIALLGIINRLDILTQQPAPIEEASPLSQRAETPPLEQPLAAIEEPPVSKLSAFARFKNWLTVHKIKSRIIAWFRLDNLKAVIAVLTGIAGLITYCFSLFGNSIDKDGKPREKVHNDDGKAFSVVVYTHGVNGRQDVVALKETKLIADFGGRRDVAKIAENGQNTFNEVDAQYRDTRIGIGLQGTEGYVLRFPDSTYLLDGSPIYLAVQPSCRFCKLAGVVRNQNAFIPNAVVSTGAFVDTTDANGYFEINLPPDKEQTEYPVTVRIKDKIVWDKFITPNPKQAAEILVEHK